jgi:hypothetical protein
METVRERLVREAAAKRHILLVHQFDGWAHWGHGDPFFESDADLDLLQGRESYELRNAGPDLAVRVHVAHGTTPEVAVRMLRKMADWVESRPEIVEGRPIEPEEEEEAKTVAALAGIAMAVADCVRLLRVIDQTKRVSGGERAAWVNVNPREIGDGPAEPWEAEDAATFASLAGVDVPLTDCVRLLRLATAARPLRWRAIDGVTRPLEWGET